MRPEETPGTARQARIRWRWTEALAAIGLSVVLWLLMIPGAGVVEVVREIPVLVSSVPRGFTVEAIEPPRVQVTLKGRRTDLFLPGADVLIRLDGLQIRLGRRRFDLSRSDVEVPPGIEVLALDPPRVQLTVRPAADVPPE